VLALAVPPLRELDRDKVLLLEHFRRFYAAQLGVPPFALDEAATQRLLQYPFPGNVRELRNIVIRLMTKYGARGISVAELEAELDLEALAPGAPADAGGLAEQAFRQLERGAPFNLDDTLKGWERAYIEAALQLAHGNISQAAKLLGVNRTTLYGKLEAKTK